MLVLQVVENGGGQLMEMRWLRGEAGGGCGSGKKLLQIGRGGRSSGGHVDGWRGRVKAMDGSTC